MNWKKNSFAAIRSVFRAQNGHNMRLRPVLPPDPSGKAYSAPQTLAGLRSPTSKGGGGEEMGGKRRKGK